MSKIAVVTGANSGIGLALSQQLAARGWCVVLGCRDQSRGQAALDLVAEAASDAPPVLIKLDLADRASLPVFADELAGHTDTLDLLVNNAGVCTNVRMTTATGEEIHFATNHLGPFALTAHLLPSLLSSRSARVVTVSSLGHWLGQPVWRHPPVSAKRISILRYADSKLANLLFAFELNRRSKDAGVSLVSLAAHPGMTHTNLVSGVTGLSGRLTTFGDSLISQDLDTGVLPTLQAATDHSLRGGDYIGPRDWFGIRGLPGPASYRRLAGDPAAARELWTVSEQLCDVRYHWDAAPAAH